MIETQTTERMLDKACEMAAEYEVPLADVVGLMQAQIVADAVRRLAGSLDDVGFVLDRHDCGGLKNSQIDQIAAAIEGIGS